MNPRDTLQFAAGGRLQGRIVVPGDKSISHRAVMFGALAAGVTEIHDCLMGEDVRSTMAAFRAMGIVIEEYEAGRRILVHGRGLQGLTPPGAVLDVGNSGTSMRLLSGILAGAGVAAVLTGDESLRRRPMRRVTEPLALMGARISTTAQGTPPLTVAGGLPLKGIDFDMKVASAQVKSAVLLAGLFATGRTCVTEPAPTRDHTERMLSAFGVRVERQGARACVDGQQNLVGTRIEVPSDISSAAFFMVGAAISPQSEVTLANVGVNPTRTGIIDILTMMGARITLENRRERGGEPVADIVVRGSQLRGIDIPAALVPLAVDEFPAIFVAASAATGVTTVRGAEELRHKESDRIESMASGLRTLGIEVRTWNDGLEIKGGQLTAGTLESHGDHRIAMAFAMAALRAQGPVRINECAPIATSFPNFLTLATQAGLRLDP